MVKGSIHKEDIIIVNIHAPTLGEPKYIKKMLTYMKGEIDNNIIIVGAFNTPLLTMK